LIDLGLARSLAHRDQLPAVGICHEVLSRELGDDAASDHAPMWAELDIR